MRYRALKNKKHAAQVGLRVLIHVDTLSIGRATKTPAQPCLSKFTLTRRPFARQGLNAYKEIKKWFCLQPLCTFFLLSARWIFSGKYKGKDFGV
jgi:hypothetical protein